MKFVASLLAAATVALAAVTASAETYTVDGVHSSVVFRIKHNNVANFYGHINFPEGSVVYDPAKPEASTFNISVKTANIATANPQRDTHLKSADFFNAAEHPTITFKSTSVKKGAEPNALDVTGELTLHGVKKTVSVKIEMTGQATDGSLIGFETMFAIKRSDYGMAGFTNILGDDVRLVVSLEAKK